MTGAFPVATAVPRLADSPECASLSKVSLAAPTLRENEGTSLAANHCSSDPSNEIIPDDFEVSEFGL